MLSHFSQKRSFGFFLTFEQLYSTESIRMRIILIHVAWARREGSTAPDLARCKQMFRLAKLLIYNDYSGKENKSNSDGVKLCEKLCKLLNANENDIDSHWYLRIVRVRKWGAVKIALSTSRNGALFWPIPLTHKDILATLIAKQGGVILNRVYGEKFGYYLYRAEGLNNQLIMFY